MRPSRPGLRLPEDEAAEQQRGPHDQEDEEEWGHGRDSWERLRFEVEG